MEFSVAERLEVPFIQEANYLCFHPTKPLLAISVSNQILIYNVINGATHGRLIAEEGGHVTHIAFVFSPSINKDSFYIAAFTDEGELYVWDELTWGLVGGTTMGVNTGTLRKVTPTPGANGIQTCTASTIQPYLFCSKPNGKDVFAIEISLNPAPNAASSGTPLTPASRVSLFVSRVDIKKSISSMECHPSKPYLAVGCTDGSIKILDYTNNKTLVSFDDLSKFGNASVSSLSWYCGEAFYLLASSLGGVLSVWGSTANAVQSMSCIGSIQSEIVSAAFHPIFEHVTEGKLASQRDSSESSTSKEKDRRSILALKSKKSRKSASTPSSSTNSSAEPDFEHENINVSGKASPEKHPFFITISASGDILAWSVHNQAGQSSKVIRPCGLLKPLSLLRLELTNRFNHLPDYYYPMHLHHKSNPNVSQGIELKPLGLLFHSKYNLTTFNFLNKAPSRKHANSAIAHNMYREQLIYTLSDLHTAYPEAILPFVSEWKAPTKNSYFNPQVSAPDFFYYLQDNNIVRYNLIQHQREVVLPLGESHEQYDCRALKFLHYREKSDEKSKGRFVVLFHGIPIANPSDSETTFLKVYGSSGASFSPASDICYWGDRHWLSLGSDGTTLSVHKWTSSKSGSVPFPKFPGNSAIAKIFPVLIESDCSLENSFDKTSLNRLFCYDRTNHRLHAVVLTATESIKADKERKDKSKTKVKYSSQLEPNYLQLYRDEVPLAVAGHSLENYSGIGIPEFVVGIITTKRALIVDLNMRILSHSTGFFYTASDSQTQSLTFLKSPYSPASPYGQDSEHQYNLFSSLINSCCWIGDSFVYNNASMSQLRYLTVSHSAQSDKDSHNLWIGDHFLQSLDSPFAVILGVLPDRIVHVSRYANQLTLQFTPVNLVEPLVLGYVDSFIKNQHVTDASTLDKCHQNLSQIIKKVVARYDCSRISEKLIRRLMSLTLNAPPEYQKAHPNQYFDLCYALLNGIGVYDFIINPQVSWPVKVEIALSQKKFTDALEILLAQRKTESAMEEQTARYLRKLANDARENGQYEIARQCYEALEDNMEILYIAAINKNFVLIQNLRERAINNGNLLLKAACERQLEIQQHLKLHTVSDNSENPLVLKNWPLNQQHAFLPLGKMADTNQWNTADKCSIQIKVEQSEGTAPKVEVTKGIDVNDIRKWFTQSIDQLLDNEADVEDKESSNAKSRPGPSSPSLSKSPERRTSRSRQRTIHRSLNLASIGSSESSSVEILEKPKDVLPNEIIPIPSPRNPALASRHFPNSANTSRNVCYRLPSNVEVPSPQTSQAEKPQEKSVEDKFLNSPIWGRIAVPTNAGTTPTKETAPSKAKFNKTGSGSFMKLQQSPSFPMTEASSFQSRFNAQPTTQRATPLDYLKKAINNLEKGLFMESMIELDNGIELLVSVADPYVNQQDVKLCILYKIALDLLLELKRVDKDVQVNQRVTQLASLLAAIPLQNKHKIVCLRLAINKNFLAENFGVVSKLIEQLFTISPDSQSLPDKAGMDEKLNKCKEKKFSDATSTTIPCRACNNPVSIAANQCSCGQRVLFCYQTLEILNEIPWLKCAFCDATYSYKSMKLGNRCSFCNFGNLIQQSASDPKSQ